MVDTLRWRVMGRKKRRKRDKAIQELEGVKGAADLLETEKMAGRTTCKPARRAPSISPQKLRILGGTAYLLPAFLALTSVFVGVMAIVFLGTSLFWSLAVLIGLLALIVVWVASQDGFCEVYEDRIILRRILRSSEIPIKQLRIQVGSQWGLLGAKALWIWPGMKKGLYLHLPLTSAGSWTKAYGLLRQLQQRGAVISATGFAPWEAIQPITFRIDYFRNVRLAGLLLPTYAAILAVDIVLRRMGIPTFNIPSMALCPALVLLARSDVSQLLLNTPEIIWSQDEVSLTKGKATLWTLGKKDVKGIVLERQALMAGAELSRLCLVTHYSRSVPLTPWSPVMREELNLIGLALGWGLEIRMEGNGVELDSGPEFSLEGLGHEESVLTSKSEAEEDRRRPEK